MEELTYNELCKNGDSKAVKQFITKHLSEKRYYRHMLSDYNRTVAFNQSIQDNVKEDSIVLDAGSGIGLLSMFASKARHVYAVEKDQVFSDISKKLMEVNKITNVTVLTKDILNLDIQTDLDGFKPNLLICELIGDHFCKEGLIAYVNNLKDRILNPIHTVIPKGGTLYARLISSNHLDTVFGFPDYLGGYDIKEVSNMLTRENTSHNVSYATLKAGPGLFMSDEIVVYDINFNEGKVCLQRKDVSLTVNTNGACSGLLIYFDINVDDNHTISTINDYSHWRTSLVRDASLIRPMFKGEKISFTMIPSDLNINMQVKVDQRIYSLS